MRLQTCARLWSASEFVDVNATNAVHERLPLGRVLSTA